MDSNVYVIIINPNDSTYNDTLNSANEIKQGVQKSLEYQIKKVMYMIIGLRSLQLRKHYIQ